MDQRKKILRYLILIISVIIPSIGLALILNLEFLETILLFPFFPLITAGLFTAFVFLFLFIFLPSKQFFSGILDRAASIPYDRFKPIIFYGASLVISFIFFTLFVLVSPKATISNIPLFSGEHLEAVIDHLLVRTQAIDESILLFLSFFIFPVLGGLTLVSIRLFKLYSYGWGVIEPKNVNNIGKSVVNLLKVLFTVSVVLVIFLALLGISPSGYPLVDYFFWLFLIIIPGSIIGAWIGQLFIVEWEIVLNSGSRKLATLRIANGFLQDDVKFENPVQVVLDKFEKEALDRLRIPTEPKEWEGRPWMTRTFILNQKDVLKKKKEIMNIQRDTMGKPIQSIGLTIHEEVLKEKLDEYEKNWKELKDLQKKFEKEKQREEETSEKKQN